MFLWVMHESSSFSTSSPKFGVVSLFNWWYIRLFHYGCDVHFSVNSDVYFFMCLFVICTSPLVKCLFKYYSHFIIISSIILSIEMSFYIQKSFIGYILWKYVILIHGISFHFSNVLWFWMYMNSPFFNRFIPKYVVSGCHVGEHRYRTLPPPQRVP